MSIPNGFEARKPQDQTRIDVNNLEELLWWSYQLGISPEKLLSLVHKFGPAVIDLKKRVRVLNKVMGK